MKFFYYVCFCLTAQNIFRKLENYICTKENNDDDIFYYVRNTTPKNANNSEEHQINIVEIHVKIINHETAEYTSEKETK
ncbi:putative SP-containing protein [Vairimorpha necatrix]|uniref:SP-containing protein n=1 Tax=Vairimorpha necatrix TaxID=6039 RepID=A0AAX4JES4_9MICR